VFTWKQEKPRRTTRSLEPSDTHPPELRHVCPCSGGRTARRTRVAVCQLPGASSTRARIAIAATVPSKLRRLVYESVKYAKELERLVATDGPISFPIAFTIARMEARAPQPLATAYYDDAAGADVGRQPVKSRRRNRQDGGSEAAMATRREAHPDPWRLLVFMNESRSALPFNLPGTESLEIGGMAPPTAVDADRERVGL